MKRDMWEAFQDTYRYMRDEMTGREMVRQIWESLQFTFWFMSIMFCLVLLISILTSCSDPCEPFPDSETWTSTERGAINQARDNWTTFAGKSVTSHISVIRELPDSDLVKSAEGDGKVNAFYLASACMVVLIRERLEKRARLTGISYGDTVVMVTMHEFGHAMGNRHSNDPLSIMSQPLTGSCILGDEFKHVCQECADYCWEAE